MLLSVFNAIIIFFQLYLSINTIYTTPSGPIYKKISKFFFDPIYKKMSQLLRYSYCLKDFYTPYLMFVFLISVNIFNRHDDKTRAHGYPPKPTPI